MTSRPRFERDEFEILSTIILTLRYADRSLSSSRAREIWASACCLPSNRADNVVVASSGILQVGPRRHRKVGSSASAVRNILAFAAALSVLSYKITHLVGPGSREESGAGCSVNGSPSGRVLDSIAPNCRSEEWMPQLRFFCSCSEFLFALDSIVNNQNDQWVLRGPSSDL
jgi:hypothetical protein